jgi:hypothetical protein
VTGDYLEAFLDAISAVRGALNEDREMTHAMWPTEIDPDNTAPVGNMMVALTHLGAVVVMNAAHAEGITTDEYLDRLMRQTITEADDPPPE